MTQPERRLGALIASRICHDLVSPVGAISNGLELMSLGSAPDGPEMTLVADSAAHANARLRFFRVAFGLSGDGASMTGQEIRNMLSATYTAKVTCNWQVDGPLSRQLTQAVFLALLCVEQAVPFGGIITIAGSETRLMLSVTGERLAPTPEHWALLSTPELCNLAALPAAQVQFALLPRVLDELGRTARIDLKDTVCLSF